SYFSTSAHTSPSFFFLVLRHPLRSTLFPYTTLFRSSAARRKRLGCRKSLSARSASTIQAAPPPGARCGSCEARSRHRALKLGSSNNPRTRFASVQKLEG